jgi:hypothetical protein
LVLLDHEARPVAGEELGWNAQGFGYGCQRRDRGSGEPGLELPDRRRRHAKTGSQIHLAEAFKFARLR